MRAGQPSSRSSFNIEHSTFNILVPRPPRPIATFGMTSWVMPKTFPHIVIVGRPNVGKSTLFNRLAGKRRALIHDLPGMTRDRLTDVVELDDGRRFELTDTGGLEYGDSPMSAYAPEIKAQAERAVEE